MPETDKEAEMVMNQYFVSKTQRDVTIWHIIHIPNDEDTSRITDVLPTLDGMHVWPQAIQFWTEMEAVRFLSRFKATGEEVVGI